MKKANDGSTRFHYVKDKALGRIEFWLTPLNKVFLIVNTRIIFPSLQGGSIVKFDDPRFDPPPKVMEDLSNILRKQRRIREDWPTPEEDEVAYAFS